MTTYDELAQRYIDTWNETDPSARRAAVDRLYTDDVSGGRRDGGDRQVRPWTWHRGQDRGSRTHHGDSSGAAHDEYVSNSSEQGFHPFSRHPDQQSAV